MINLQNIMPVSYKLLKGMNESLVINIIRQREPISRVDIARLTGLTQPTVTNITNRLLESNLIMEYMMGESSGGGRPVLLKINPEALNVIVIHISSNKLFAYLTDGDINVIKHDTVKIKNLNKEQIIDDA